MKQTSRKQQTPDSKGVTHSNDKQNNIKEQGQQGNLHQNMKHSPMQQDR